MGGAAGHIKHIWEHKEFTFKDLKHLNENLISNKLKCYEKLDGINLLLTYKNGKVLISRSPLHLKNYGENALDINKLKLYNEERKTNQCVRNAYENTIIDFQNVFNKSKLNLNNIFQEGKHWFNIEILYNETEHIIPYNLNQLCIHHIKELDINGKTLNIISEDEMFDNLINEIKYLQKYLNKTFIINKTNCVNINVLTYYKFYKELELIKSSANLTDDNKISDFIDFYIIKYINESINVDKEFCKLLSKRWSKENKEIAINILLKNKDQKIKEWVKNNDIIIKNKIEEILEPLILFYCKFGIFILNNTNGFINNKESKEIIKNKLLKSLNYINQFKINDNKKYLYRFDKLDKFNSVLETEGIVFNYKNHILKLTGNFTSILKICNVILNNDN